MLSTTSTQNAKRRRKSNSRPKTFKSPGLNAIQSKYRAIKSKFQANPILWLPILLVGFGLVTGGFIALQRELSTLPLVYAFSPSPNFDDRPFGTKINCLVIHATVEPTTEGTMDIFLTPSRKVSAHFVVGRDGRVVQMVPVEKRAWHAGVSVFEGVSAVNNYSVGIEMVNLNDGKDPYTVEQMESVAGIIRLLRSKYDIPDSRIVSHAQIALPAGRKNDPVGFDFQKIKEMAREGASNNRTDLPPPSSDDPANSKEERF